jgi:hypothetical protein
VIIVFFSSCFKSPGEANDASKVELQDGCQNHRTMAGDWPVIWGGPVTCYVASHDVFKHKAINGYTWHFGAKNSKNQETNQRIS